MRKGQADPLVIIAIFLVILAGGYMWLVSQETPGGGGLPPTPPDCGPNEIGVVNPTTQQVECLPQVEVKQGVQVTCILGDGRAVDCSPPDPTNPLSVLVVGGKRVENVKGINFTLTVQNTGNTPLTVTPKYQGTAPPGVTWRDYMDTSSKTIPSGGIDRWYGREITFNNTWEGDYSFEVIVTAQSEVGPLTKTIAYNFRLEPDEIEVKTANMTVSLTGQAIKSDRIDVQLEGSKWNFITMPGNIADITAEGLLDAYSKPGGAYEDSIAQVNTAGTGYDWQHDRGSPFYDNQILAGREYTIYMKYSGVLTIPLQQ